MRIELSATAEQRAEMEKAAESCGLSLSAWLRMVALRGAKEYERVEA
jgi:hypothetical protein